MYYGYGMVQQQAAKMTLSPKAQTMIKILQLSTPELQKYLQQELADNPLAEFVDDGWNWADARGRNGGMSRPGADPLEFAKGNERSLEDELLEQLRFAPHLSAAVRQIVRYLIGNLDANGYVQASLEETARRFGVPLETAERALVVLQGFEPAGIGARSLSECLLLQARRQPECPALVPELLRHYLADVAAHRIPKLANRLQTSQEEIKAAVEAIKKLNPRPAAAYAPGGDTRYIVPDVAIEAEGGQFVVRVFDWAAPQLAWNPHYTGMLRSGGLGAEARAFLAERLHAVSFLRRCLAQRKITLLRVTEAIAAEQIAYFRHGPASLKPLNLKTIADQLHIHESTVSRSTAGKYAQTPWGIRELSYFFPPGLQTARGEQASPEYVKSLLKVRLDGEDPAKPYSDRQLAELLAEQGIRIARRTVMKYREELGFPSSVKRKR